MKAVQVVGHAFDCVPGHVTITSRGTGTNLKIAIGRAVKSMLKDPRLLRKRVHEFKMAVVVQEEE